MTPTSDRDLVRRYVDSDDHDAFADLVRRYFRLVRSAALRQTREAALADDVTQAVMIIFARRARELTRPNIVLASWLFTVTHHVSRNALRSAARRAHHERLAISSRIESESMSEASRIELQDLIDVGITQLPASDRGVVVLHYLNDCSHEESARMLGITAEAARSRTRRAVARLRDFFESRGLTVTDASLAVVLHGASTSASPVIVDSAIRVALLGAAGNISTASRPILLASSFANASTALVTKVAAVLVLASATALGGISIAHHVASTSATALVQVAPPATAPATAAATKFSADVTRNMHFDFIGVGPFPAETTSWFALDGQPIELPDEHLEDNEHRSFTQPTHQLAIIVRITGDSNWGLEVVGATSQSSDATDLGDGSSLHRVRFELGEPRDSVSVSMKVATEPWKAAAKFDASPDEQQVKSDHIGDLQVPPTEQAPNGGSQISIRSGPLPDKIVRAIAIDSHGQSHVPQSTNVDRPTGQQLSTFVFENLSPDQIRSFIFETRDYTKELVVKDISLTAGHRTKPQITVSDLATARPADKPR